MRQRQPGHQIHDDAVDEVSLWDSSHRIVSLRSEPETESSESDRRDQRESSCLRHPYGPSEKRTADHRRWGYGCTRSIRRQRRADASDRVSLDQTVVYSKQQARRSRRCCRCWSVTAGLESRSFRIEYHFDRGFYQREHRLGKSVRSGSCVASTARSVAHHERKRSRCVRDIEWF